MRISMVRLIRATAFSLAAAAPLLAASAFWSEHAFARPVKTATTCGDKFQACMSRCWKAAEGASKDITKQIDSAERCKARTCDKQRDNCEAAAGKGKDAKIQADKATKPGTAGPVRPLTPQTATKPVTAAPRQPLTPQKVTGSGSNAPLQPLSRSPDSRRNR